MKSIELPANLDNLNSLIDFVINGIKDTRIDKKTLSKLRLVCEEIIINIINYAYPDGDGDVFISFDITGDNKLVIVVMDNGISFNPLLKEEPDIYESVENRDIGGLGIFMVKKIMDSIEYERVDDKNIITMSKVI